MKKIDSVSINDFVLRQAKDSGKTYTENLTFDNIASHAQEQLSNGHYKEGYRDGVRIVTGSHSLTDQFICPFVKINENTMLVSSVVKRQIGEEAYIQTRAKTGTPLQAGRVEYILYRHNVLAENDEQSTDAVWELISIHAIPEGVDKLPMGPVTMMRNQLKLTGGTKAHYSPEEWAEAVRFWQKYAALDES